MTEKKEKDRNVKKIKQIESPPKSLYQSKATLEISLNSPHVQLCHLGDGVTETATRHSDVHHAHPTVVNGVNSRNETHSDSHTVTVLKSLYSKKQRKRQEQATIYRK